MKITLNLSPELVETIKKWADAEKLSLDELVENVLKQYITGDEPAWINDDPNDEEQTPLSKL
jgi:hypothetical protein